MSLRAVTVHVTVLKCPDETIILYKTLVDS